MKQITVDAGMYGTKGYCEGNKFYIRTLVDEVSNIATDGEYRVKFFDKEYVVGDETISTSYDSSKQRLANKLTTYLCISEFISYNGEQVDLIIGMPIEHWLDRDRRNEFENYMKTSYTKFTVKKKSEEYKEVAFSINKVVAVPEGIGYLYVNKNYIKRTVAVLDCGGCNFQGAVFKNMVPIKETCFTLNEGANFYFNAVKQALNSKFNLNYQDYQIHDLLEFGSSHTKKKEIEEEVNKVTRKHIQKVINACNANNWNIHDMHIILTGGGSSYFSKYLSDYFHEFTISDNVIWDNVIGFSKIGEILCRKEK